MEYMYKLDWFSTEVGVKFKGKSRYRTKIGVLATLIVFGLCIKYALLIIYEPLKGGTVQNNYNEVIQNEYVSYNVTDNIDDSNDSGSNPDDINVTSPDRYDQYTLFYDKLKMVDILSSTQEIVPQVYGFVFGARFSNAPNDETGIKLVFKLQSKNSDGVETSENIELEQCNSSHFTNLFKPSLDSIDISSYLCPKRVDIPLIGNSKSNVHKYIEITAEICNNSTMNNCQEMSILESIYQDTTIDLFYSNPFNGANKIFAAELNIDYSLPVLNHLATTEILKIRSYYHQYNEYSNLDHCAVSRSLTQSKFMSSLSQSRFIFELDSISTSTISETIEVPDFSERRLTESNEETEHKDDLISTQYFVFYLLSQIGGLAYFLKSILSLIISYFATRCLKYDLVNRWYQLQDLRDLQNEYTSKVSNKRKLNRVACDLNGIVENSDNYGDSENNKVAVQKLATSSKNFLNSMEEEVKSSQPATSYPTKTFRHKLKALTYFKTKHMHSAIKTDMKDSNCVNKYNSVMQSKQFKLCDLFYDFVCFKKKSCSKHENCFINRNAKMNEDFLQIVSYLDITIISNTLIKLDRQYTDLSSKLDSLFTPSNHTPTNPAFPKTPNPPAPLLTPTPKPPKKRILDILHDQLNH